MTFMPAVCNQFSVINLLICRVAPKICAIFLYAFALSNIRFSKLFHCQNQEKICNNTITKDLTTSRGSYTTLWNVKCLKSNNWKRTTSVTTYFNKLTENNSFLVLVNCHILQFLHQMFNVSILLLNDAFNPATPLTNCVIILKRCDSLPHSVTFHKVV